MKKLIFAALALFAVTAQATQVQGFKQADQKRPYELVYYTVYQSESMSDRDLGGTAIVLRGCEKVTPSTFMRRENLAYDRNIAGAFYCKRGQGSSEYYVIVKKFEET